MRKLIIGSHVSFNSKNGLVGSAMEMISNNANTMMIYTGPPQNTLRSSIDIGLVEQAHKIISDHGIDINNILVHAPYIINLASTKNHEFNIDFLNKEIDRCITLGINKLVIHPGSLVDLSYEEGINNIIDVLNNVNDKIMILLETMSGKGSEVGSNFNDLKLIIDKSRNKNIYVCMDTCHLSDAGYDISNFDSVLDEFDKIIGLSYLKAIHINDSKNIRDSHKDRHDNIGYGMLGFDNLIKVIYNPRIMDIPHILETPYYGELKDISPYKSEIEMIRRKEFVDFKK